MKCKWSIKVLYPRHFYTLNQYGLYGVSATDDNPCDLFDRIDFPVDEFFPPERCEFLEDGEEDPSVESDSDDKHCGCGKNGGGRR